MAPRSWSRIISYQLWLECGFSGHAADIQAVKKMRKHTRNHVTTRQLDRCPDASLTSGQLTNPQVKLRSPGSGLVRRR
ncbi:hypothetical protein RRG08_039698 [Elysia crispata]|uniref:Uncharacterized protein n=1 Tax=Elysia crispata TaxID=231223 RepID=A0AAE0YBM6_9GAST|nr:hypothetical protein RRG08_039698 [Elysia crispata]